MKRASVKKVARKPTAVAKGGRSGFNNVKRPHSKVLKRG